MFKITVKQDFGVYDGGGKVPLHKEWVLTFFGVRLFTYRKDVIERFK